MDFNLKRIDNIVAIITTHNRLFIGLWIGLVLLFVTYKGILPGWTNQSGDFNNYYTSAALVMEGQEIEQFYDNQWFFENARNLGMDEGAKFAPFPPITAFLFSPLAGFDFAAARKVWLVVNCLLLLLLPFRLQRLCNLDLRWTIAISGLFFVPLAANLNFGQVYLFLTFLIVEALIIGTIKTRRGLAAIIISVVALLKYFPLLFTFFLFNSNKQQGLSNYLKQQNWMVYFLGTTIVLILGTYLAFPEAYNAYFATFTNHLQGSLSGQGSHAVAFQSIDSLLNNLFQSNSPGGNQYPLLKVIFKALFFLGIGWFSFKIFRQDRFRFNSVNSSIFCIGAFVLIPASASYHFLFLVIPVAYIFKWLTDQKNNLGLLLFTVILLAVFTIQYHHIPQIKFSTALNYIIHYPRLWSLVILFGYLTYLKLETKNG